MITYYNKEAGEMKITNDVVYGQLYWNGVVWAGLSVWVHILWTPGFGVVNPMYQGISAMCFHHVTTA